MRILGSIALVLASLFFALGLISAGLPHYFSAEISQRYALDAQAFSLLILMLPAVYIPMQLVAGFLLDRYGARVSLMAAAALVGLGLVLSVVVEMTAVGAAGRVLFALGASFAFPGALFIAARCFDKSRFATLAGSVQALGFAAIGWWYFAGETSVSAVSFPMRYYFAAAAAVLLALLFAVFGTVKPVQDGEDRPGFIRQFFGEIGSVLIRPRLWLIVLAAAFVGVPLGLYAPIWFAGTPLPARSLSGLASREVATLFVVSFALGSLLAGFVSDGSQRRRGTLVLFQLLAAAAFALLALPQAIGPIWIGALLAAGGFFAGSSVLYYALGNDRAPPHHAGLFLALIHAGFVAGAAGSVYASSFVQPLVEVVDLTQYFAPLCLIVAACLSLVTPDKGPMAVAGPVGNWEKAAKATSPAVAESALAETVPEQREETFPSQPLEDGEARGVTTSEPAAQGEAEPIGQVDAMPDDRPVAEGTPEALEAPDDEPVAEGTPEAQEPAGVRAAESEEAAKSGDAADAAVPEAATGDEGESADGKPTAGAQAPDDAGTEGEKTSTAAAPGDAETDRPADDPQNPDPLVQEKDAQALGDRATDKV